ncbi:acyl-CoA dehydrogenase family protein [Bradyrhizobium sp. C-145]|uniref:acyl-CoA dehydrogenase family protein n=1 Tax=Bradyrhizobium sp. C-145 TaxID=574727 RepID=UPI00201B76C8|nr:acyl-CoA dehydrogenase family protein [Bradyrhizobium sp. C-145]UQR61444.1 acyl-CoA dehydrogenase family protein [Bradyrhizobium sp. C-145]
MHFERSAPPSSRDAELLTNSWTSLNRTASASYAARWSASLRGKCPGSLRRNGTRKITFAELAALGVMGLTVPEKYGGASRDILGTMVVIEELSRRSLAVAVPYIMAASYAGMNLVECATEDQKRELLARVASGSLMFAYGWTEPNAGADLASVTTRAKRVQDKVRINGTKRFCSGAAIADYIYALVRTGPKDVRYKNLSLILVPPTAVGITITPIESLGMKGAATTDVTVVDVEVPFTNVIGAEAGLEQWLVDGDGLWARCGEAGGRRHGSGHSRRRAEDAWSYALERVQFGKAISNYQSIQHKLAEMKTQLHAARLVLYHAAWLANQHQRCGVETSMAKLFAPEVAKSVALECQTIFGAYGYVKNFDSERDVRGALLLPIIERSWAVQRNNIFKWSKLAAWHGAIDFETERHDAGWIPARRTARSCRAPHRSNHDGSR